MAIKLRSSTHAQWQTANPILAHGEFAFSTDVNDVKIGNAYHSWNNLPYANLKGPRGLAGQTAVKSGTIVWLLDSIAPSGYIAADGSVCERSQYPSLSYMSPPSFSGIGAEFGTASAVGATITTNSPEPVSGVDYLFDGIAFYTSTTTMTTTNVDFVSEYNPFDVIIKFAQPIKITEYFICSNFQLNDNWGYDAPRNWSLYASNNGVNWVMLDTQIDSSNLTAGSNISMANAGFVSTKGMHSIPVNNYAQFLYYKISFTAFVNYFQAGGMISEISLKGNYVPSVDHQMVLPSFAPRTYSGVTFYPYIKV